MTATAHVLVFPFPLQGHINCMLHFAAALVGAGVHVTFLHTDHNIRRVGCDSPAASPSPRLRFASVPDGLPEAHPRSVGDIMEVAVSLASAASVAYRALLARLPPVGDHRHGNDDVGVLPPVTCVVADGALSWAIDVAEEVGVPALAFRTISACGFLAYLSVPKLLELGELPFPAGGDLDEPVRGVPGMESFLRRRDLPSSCRENMDVAQLIAELTAHSSKARALILNTAASLEPSALAHIKPRMHDVLLHAMSPSPAAASSLWREDDGCLAWLDGKADRTVVYVSLGSLAVIFRDQFTELFSGLVAAGYPFLWVHRPGMVAEASMDAVVQEAVRAAAGCRGNARVVAWAPQRDVLRHRAVGCFLTHAGWNSTLEAVVEGVPMVCWPFSADQPINSRFVGAVWRTGLDIKDVCDRDVVERMVREAMESGEIRGLAQELAQQVRLEITDGGSSSKELERLVSFIKKLSTLDKESDQQNQG
ncbi:hypothetical protein ACP70R_023012 [Stipagrostis hirtigluma subsp. patula]